MRRPQNWKKSPTCYGKKSFFTQYISSKQVGDFFQIFVAYSEKLNFTSLLFKHFDCFDTSALTLKNEKNKERKELKKKHQTKSN